MDDALVSLKLDTKTLASLQAEAKKKNIAIADIVRDAIRRDLRRRQMMEMTDDPSLRTSTDWLLRGIKNADPSRA